MKPEIKEINIKPGETNIIMKYPGLQEFVKNVMDFFQEARGINYVSFTAESEEHGQFEIIIQRKNGKTPAEINSELKRIIKQLEKTISDMQDKQ